MADETQSLKFVFGEAESLRTKLSIATNSNSATFQEELGLAIVKYEICLAITARISLFSPNETLDDISTGDLQFLLPHYYVAELLVRKTSGDRQMNLQNARNEIEQFLRLLDTYDVLSRDDARLYEQYKENPDLFSTASTTDPAARRQTKIARFKEEKLLKQKLETLRQNSRAARNDDLIPRNLHLTNIKFCTHSAFQMLESMAQEIQILALVQSTPSTARQLTSPDVRLRNGEKPTDTYSERLDVPLSQLIANGKVGPILSRDGRPLQPFTLLDSRQRLQQGVFRPDHNLPTMTIDEYLEEERRRGGIIEGGGPQSGIKPQVDEDDLEKADEETMKARAWDDFKDDNPRGAGNTMNMG